MKAFHLISYTFVAAVGAAAAHLATMYNVVGHGLMPEAALAVTVLVILALAGFDTD